MDFPIQLTEPINTIDSLDELKATIYHLLKNPIGSLLQSNQLGSHVAIHATDADAIADSVKRTIEEIPGASVVDITRISGTDEAPLYNVTVSYRSETINFDLNLSNL